MEDAVAGHLHLPLLQWMVEASNHQDVQYMQTLMAGRNAVGEIGRSYIFPPDDNPAETSLEQWSANPQQRNLRVLQNVKATGDTQLDRKAWEKTLKEVEKGYCQFLDDQEYDLNKVCITGRFPKWELKSDDTWAVRNISNWKESGGNAATAMRERYTPDDLTTVYATVRALKEALGEDTVLAAYKADYEMAFRQPPTAPTQAHITLEAVWDPTQQKTRVLEVFGQAF